MIDTFTTPNGNAVTAFYREDTSDWNTVSACVHDDEYGLAEHSWSGVAVDVGAHIGGATLALLADNPNLAVIAIEALPENAALLRENVERNGFAGNRCRVLNAAASNSREDVTVAYGTTKGSPFVREHRFIGGAVWQGPRGKRVTVPAVSLSDCVANGPISLVKIDCEGCEWSFLDDPAVKDVAEFRGEGHPRGDKRLRDIRGLLEATHDVTLDDTLDFGPFRAVRR